MTRGRRFSLITLSLALLTVVVFLLLLRVGLTPPFLTAGLESSLRHQLDAPVTLGSASVLGSRLHFERLAAYEADASRDSPPWLQCEAGEGTVSALQMALWKAGPRDLELHGVKLLLRFDSQGRLLTNLPATVDKARPPGRLTIRKAEVTLRQEGRPDLVLQLATAAIDSSDGELSLHGSLADATWSQGTLELTVAAGVVSVKLASAKPVHVTQAMLEALPFVAPAVWRELKIQGDTPVDLKLRYDQATKALRHRIELSPSMAQVHIPAIDLRADGASGNVVIEDGVVTLRDVRGRTAEGELLTAGLLDFRSQPALLHFDLEAKRLDLHSLPRPWGLPPRLGGRLQGTAKLTLAVGDGKVVTTGQGRGLIVEPTLGDLPIKKPIELKLRADGPELKFETNEIPDEPVSEDVSKLIFVATTLQPGAQQDRRAGLFTEAVNRLHQGLSYFISTLIREGSQVFARSKAKPAPAKPRANVLEASVSLDDVELQELARNLGVKLPFPAIGKISVDVKIGIPLQATQDAKAYRVAGTARVRRLDLAGLILEQLSAKVLYENGVLQLTHLSGTLPARGTRKPGSIEGNARMELIPAGNLTSNLRLLNLPLDQIGPMAGLRSDRLDGVLSADVRLSAATDHLRDPVAWEGLGLLRADRFRAYGWTVEEFTARAKLAGGSLRLTEAIADVEGTRLAGTGDLSLEPPYSFQAKAEFRQADLTALQRLAPDLRPPVPIHGQLDVTAALKGTLAPLAYVLDGTVTARDLRLKEFKVSNARGQWQAVDTGLKLTDLEAGLYDGKLSGRAALPIRSEQTGSIDLRFEDLDVGAMSKDIAALPFRLEGKTGGTLTSALSAVEPGGSREFTAKVALHSPTLRVQGIATEGFQGTVAVRRGDVDYRFNGQTLGGRFQLTGTVPAVPAQKPPQPEAKLRVDGAQLARLWDVLKLPSLRLLRGQVDLSVTMRPDQDGGAPVGTGRFILQRLRWGETELLPEVRGDVRMTPNELRLRELTGVLGEGIVRGQISIKLHPNERSWFTLDLDRVEASRLLAPWPDLADAIQGPIGARLRGNLGREWSGTGTVSLTRGKLFKVETADWRLPITWTFVPESGRTQVEVHEFAGQLAHGRLQGRASLGFGLGSRMEGSLRFFNVDLQTLLRQAGEFSQVGVGQLTGRFDFGGSDVRSFDDLTGSLAAKLTQTQAFEMPLFRQIAPYVVPGQAPSTRFETGYLRARLQQGVFRVQRLSLAGPASQLYVDGMVTRQGRVNLDVLATNAQFSISPATLSRLGLKIPLTGPVPVVLLLEARDYLANRVLHLRVTGTIRTPNIRVDPLPLLTEEAIRFFLNRSSIPIP